MELNGLTINFLGDSITEGYGTTDSKKVFHQIIKEKYHLEHAYNYGLSGTRIARQIMPTKENTQWDLTFELRSDIMDRNADAVVVFGGTNDFGHGDAPFGVLESEDVNTFCGAVNSLIKKLVHDFPKAKIIFMTPLHRSDETQPSNPDSKILKDYANAILELCKKHGIDVIDLFNLNPLETLDTELLPDGVHPSNIGHSIMAEVIGEELLKI